MKKTERLNDMMMFLNNKNSFNIKDIMERYHISRSSAIRDIKSLEELGMPIYSKSGRNGSYKILPNRLLSPIVFTIDEVYSLYFAMLTLTAYQSTPFHLSVEKLKLKFEKCLSEEQIHALHKMETVFRLNTVEHSNSSTCLKDILKMAIKESPCIIEYKKQDIHEYTVQFFDISSAFGQWYGTAYNFETEKIQVFRCDRIQSVNATALFKGQGSITDFYQFPLTFYLFTHYSLISVTFTLRYPQELPVLQRFHLFLHLSQQFRKLLPLL